MSFIGETDLRNIIRNSIHFHEKPFNIFGLTINGLGNTGITDSCLDENGKSQVISGNKLVFHQDGKQIYQVGDFVGAEQIPDLKNFNYYYYKIETVKSLPAQIHGHDLFSKGNKQKGFSYILKPIPSSAA